MRTPTSFRAQGSVRAVWLPVLALAASLLPLLCPRRALALATASPEAPLWGCALLVAIGALAIGLTATALALVHARRIAADAAQRVRERERALEHALAAAEAGRADAETANRAKGELLATLGHDLRNPLNAISSAAAVLGCVESDTPAADQAHEIIRRQLTQVTRLIEDILDVAKETSGAIALALGPLDLGLVVRRTVALLEDAGRTAGHPVHVEAHEVWGVADEARVEQIVTHLVETAAHYTAAGERIFVRIMPVNRDAVLEVGGVGRDVPAELLAHVLDPPSHGDRSPRGHGLGLTLVRRLVELHQGRLTADSHDPGRGTTFTVRLPRTPTPEREPVAAHHLSGDAAGARTERRPGARRLR